MHFLLPVPRSQSIRPDSTVKFIAKSFLEPTGYDHNTMIFRLTISHLGQVAKIEGPSDMPFPLYRSKRAICLLSTETDRYLIVCRLSLYF